MSGESHKNAESIYPDIGLGTPNTWHGTPDIRVRAGEVHFFYGGKGKGGTGSESGSDAGSDAESDAESDGMTTKIEGKISSKAVVGSAKPSQTSYQ